MTFDFTCNSEVDRETAKIIGEILLLDKYPDAQVIKNDVEDGMEVTSCGELINTLKVNITAVTHKIEQINITIKISND